MGASVSAAEMNGPEVLAFDGDPHVQLGRLRTRVAELEESNSALRRSNRDLEGFAFAASHDLQEPLRMIATYAQLLAKKCDGLLDQDSAMFVGNIVDGATRMRELLAGLLAYMELTAQPEAVTGAVDLNQVVDTAKQNLKASIDENCAVITRDELPPLKAHARDFVCLFQNLIANGIKYRSAAPPRIHISAYRDGDELRFAVSDNGIGIEPKFHKEVFEPFKRLHSREVPGAGLGLAICQRVVDRYAGRIWVESNAGHGATFLFTVPDAADLPPKNSTSQN